MSSINCKKYTISYKQRFFFNSALVLLTFFMNRASNVAQVLFNIYKHQHTETLCNLLYLCPCLELDLFMSYICDLFFIYIFIFIIITCMDTEALVILLIFKNMSYNFWVITWMRNVNNFQIVKVQSQGVKYHLLDFLAISAWCCLSK